ncbi:MAG: tetratricopeptide repeat protein [Alphaproteobacteria bacterium]|jgi:cytochrome c-type biogenesis protein CcmH/NrfG/predicted porin|nr:tetratricopeptide repeat protein [Alphaproteobacteria bacterium]
MTTAEALAAARGLFAEGKLGVAANLLDQIIAREPACGPALYQRGLIAARNGNHDRAGEFFERALVLAPDAPEILLSLATVRHEQGDTALAAQLSDKAMRFTRSPATLYRLGILLQQAGEQSAAEAAFEKALDVDPQNARAYYGLSLTRKFTTDDPHIARIEKLANSRDLSDEEKVFASFALGKAQMDSGDTESAFASFAAANAFKKKSMKPFDVAGFNAYIDRIISLMSRAAIGTLRAAAVETNDSNRPIFVIGMPRSGSTLVDQVLSSYPGIASIGESPLFGKCVPALPDAGARPLITPALVENLPALLRGIGDRYIAGSDRAGQGAQRVVDKMLFNYLWVGVIRLALPNAKIIHCMRDPRDIALSLWQLHFPHGMGWTYDLRDIGAYYIGYKKLMDHWRDVFPGEIQDVKYEDMVASQESQSRALLEFCGLPWDARVLDFHNREGLVKTASAAQVRQPIYGTSVAKWKKYERHLAPLLEVLDKAKLGVAALLLCGVAASPARADIHLDLGGYARSYVTYSDSDESAAGAGRDLRSLDLRREIEMHFSGERTLDSGLTVGVKTEFKLGNEGASGHVRSITGGNRDPDQFDEGFIYFSGGWGRFQLGAKDGAAYLLGVQAPSADAYIDGMRLYTQTWRLDVWDDGMENLSFMPANATLRLNYDNSNFGNIDRATYLTPKWNGLQLGASYAPENSKHGVDDAFRGADWDDVVGRFEDAVDIAARYEGKWGDVKLTTGAGYSTASPQIDAVAGNNGSDSHRTFTSGVNLGWKEWSIGGAYKHASTGVEGPDNAQKVTVAGLAWDSMPLHLGVSWYNMVLESNAFSIGLADDLDVTRITAGGWYQMADGFSLRGTVSRLDVDNGTNSPIDPTQWQVAIGTEITF